MNKTERLIELFKEFPGIGPRQAKRFAYFLFGKNESYKRELSTIISSLHQEVSVCTKCQRFFQKKNGENICNICTDEKRDKSLLMLVCYDIDFENIEKSKTYSGYYFILGGTVPVLEKEPERRIRQTELLEQIAIRKKEGLKEVIIAMNYTPEGEHTLSYLTLLLQKEKEAGLILSSLGRGLSTGTELEYSDGETIKNALNNRVK